jgi:hypothetical protein
MTHEQGPETSLATGNEVVEADAGRDDPRPGIGKKIAFAVAMVLLAAALLFIVSQIVLITLALIRDMG